MFRVAISGQANTGKNTLANIIWEGLHDRAKKDDIPGYWVDIIAFADPIKEMGRAMFPSLPRKYFYGASKWRKSIIPNAFKHGQPLTVRQLLIDLGTGVGREYQDNVWLDNFDHRFAKSQKRHRQAVIVTDTRFRNEFDHLKKNGFYQIRLYRDTGEPTINHVSETDQQAIKDSEFDYIIFNNKSLDSLAQEVKTNIIPYVPFI